MLSQIFRSNSSSDDADLCSSNSIFEAANRIPFLAVVVPNSHLGQKCEPKMYLSFFFASSLSFIISFHFFVIKISTWVCSYEVFKLKINTAYSLMLVSKAFFFLSLPYRHINVVIFLKSSISHCFLYIYLILRTLISLRYSMFNIV